MAARLLLVGTAHYTSSVLFGQPTGDKTHETGNQNRGDRLRADFRRDILDLLVADLFRRRDRVIGPIRRIEKRRVDVMAQKLLNLRTQRVELFLCRLGRAIHRLSDLVTHFIFSIGGQTPLLFQYFINAKLTIEVPWPPRRYSNSRPS